VEEEDVGTGAEPPATRAVEQPGRLGRLLLRGLLLGLVAGAIGFRAGDWPVAAGAFTGSLAAAVYAWGYLRSHLGRARRARIFDPKLARHSVARIVALGVLGAAIWSMGREPFVGYLLAFAGAFAVLVALEAPAVARELRANGLMG
jgi:hypothetical protein